MADLFEYPRCITTSIPVTPLGDVTIPRLEQTSAPILETPKTFVGLETWTTTRDGGAARLLVAHTVVLDFSTAYNGWWISKSSTIPRSYTAFGDRPISTLAIEPQRGRPAGFKGSDGIATKYQ